MTHPLLSYTLAAFVALAVAGVSEAHAVMAPANPSPSPVATPETEDRQDRMMEACQDAGGTHLSRGECMGGN